MLANYSDLFDSLLVIAGLVLIIIGLVMFIRSKSSGDASSVEAFGIKLNVTHPSLILVLVGVGLMLAPRLLPGLPGKPDANPPAQPAIASDAPDLVTEASSNTAPAAPANPATPPQVGAGNKPTSSTQSAPTPSQSTPRPSRTVTASSAPTPSAAPSRPARAAAATPTPAPVVVQTPEARTPPPPTTPAISTPPPVAAAPTPAPSIAKPAPPLVAYAAMGLPINRDFWSGETQATYTRRIHTSLQQAGQSVLRMSTRNLNLAPAEFNRWWNESRDYPVSRGYCAAASAPRALISAHVETPVTHSNAESAYWPVFKLRLYHCATHRIYRQHKSLSPFNSDEWPFSTELNGEIERFLRTYRGDLTD